MRRPIVSNSWSVICLAVAVGAAAACSSSNSSGTGGAGGGAGGSGGGAGGSGIDGSAHQDSSSGDTAADAFSPASIALTSTALTEGAAFAAANTCAGVNTSPPLTWTAGPAGTMSYAVALIDVSINAVHWVIYDIPAVTMSLPAALPGDTTLTTPVSAKQIHRAAFFGAGGAYRGPCPSGATHTYRFEVSALGTTTLAGVTGASTSDEVQALVAAAALAHGDLNGTSNATAPPADAAAGQ
jgi:Raf kinase inhibitor-like YbhB/YbcL family protein